MSRTYRSIVLQGGAAYGAFQAGCLQGVLSKAKPGTTFNSIVTSSVGSLNGVMLASQPMDDLLPGANKAVDIWVNEIAGKEASIYKPPLFDVEKSRFKRFWLWLRRARPALFEASLLEPIGLTGLLKKYVDTKSLWKEGTPEFYCNALCLGNLMTVYFSKKSLLSLKMTLGNGSWGGVEEMFKIFLASTAVSCVFPPVSISIENLGEDFLEENPHFKNDVVVDGYPVEHEYPSMDDVRRPEDINFDEYHDTSGIQPDKKNVLFVDGAVRDNAPVSYACKKANEAMASGDFDSSEVWVIMCSNNDESNAKWQQESKHLPMGVHVALRTFQAMSDEIADQDIIDCRITDWDHPIELKVWKPPQEELRGELLTFQKDDVLFNVELGKAIGAGEPTTELMCGHCDES